MGEWDRASLASLVGNIQPATWCQHHSLQPTMAAAYDSKSVSSVHCNTNVFSKVQSQHKVWGTSREHPLQDRQDTMSTLQDRHVLLVSCSWPVSTICRIIHVTLTPSPWWTTQVEGRLLRRVALFDHVTSYNNSNKWLLTLLCTSVISLY